MTIHTSCSSIPSKQKLNTTLQKLTRPSPPKRVARQKTSSSRTRRTITSRFSVAHHTGLARAVIPPTTLSVRPFPFHNAYIHLPRNCPFYRLCERGMRARIRALVQQVRSVVMLTRTHLKDHMLSSPSSKCTIAVFVDCKRNRSEWGVSD